MVSLGVLIIGFIIICITVAILLAAVMYLVFGRIAFGRWDTRFFRSDFDERQQLARGRASRDAFGTVIVLLCVWYLVEALELSLPFSGPVIPIFIACAGVAVYSVECIFRDAYIGLHNHPVLWAVADLFVLVSNLYVARKLFTAGENGWTSLLLAILLGIVLVAFGLKTLLNRIHTENDAEE